MRDRYPKQAGHERNYPPKNEAIRLGMDLEEWNRRIEDLIQQKARIITFRGAGTVNGIEPGAASKAVKLLHDYIDHVTADGTTVALLFDGDADNRDEPDIGSVFGGLTDSFTGNPRVQAIAAQTEGWYSPRVKGGAIESATRKPYETYVFPDKLPGSHASLTQSQALASYPNYEQVFVGPAGPIAFSQLEDLNNKTADRPKDAEAVKVTVLATHNNPNLDGKLTTQFEDAAGDEQKRAKIQAKITQRREQPYGALFTPTGAFNVNARRYPNIAFTVTHLA